MEKELLKIVICGSVDDGKSTLIGHMLYDAKLIFVDQEQALELDSKVGTDGTLDYSLLLDGLKAEREQGITIDVAYRYFSTKSRSFIVADSPGHEEYTRNMAVGASFAFLALILLDASKGVLTQTRRHVRICAFMGIRHFLFAVNKMDLVSYSCDIFDVVRQQINNMMQQLEICFDSVTVIPVSATCGDNLTTISQNMPWYTGQPLLNFLETVDIDNHSGDGTEGFMMSVQRVSRSNCNFRGFQGEIYGGRISVGETITVLPSGENARVSRILSAGREVLVAGIGEAVTICLDSEVDVSRGCVLAGTSCLHVGLTFAAELLWLDDTPLKENGHYILCLGSVQMPVTVCKLCYRIDIQTGEHVSATEIQRNEFALCEMECGVPLVYATFIASKALGSLILVDRITNATSACGTVVYPLGEEGRVFRQKITIDRKMREKKNGHRAVTIWMTGLSGAGKSTLADAVEQSLYGSGVHTMLLDGDNVRMGLCWDLGFSDPDRKENIRRAAEVAKLLNDAGVIVLAAFVSPFQADRKMVREILGEGYIEVYVQATIETCIDRDIKGHYQKALRGEIRNFTGISSPYEVPQNPDMVVDTDRDSIEICRDQILQLIRTRL